VLRAARRRAWALGQPPLAAAVIGFGLSLSSTPLVLQVLAERGQLKTQYGARRSGFCCSRISPCCRRSRCCRCWRGTPAPAAPGGGLLKLLAVIAVVIGGGRLLLRPALRIVARVRVGEVFTAAALLTVIATALLASLVGLSMALGAFLAGVLLADSEFRHELEADLEPFKGLLLGLFFVAVGMSANLGLLKSEPLTLLALTCGFLLIKIIAVSALGKLARQRGDSARRLGFALRRAGSLPSCCSRSRRARAS